MDTYLQQMRELVLVREALQSEATGEDPGVLKHLQPDTLELVQKLAEPSASRPPARCYSIAKTGATVTPVSALALLQR